MDTDVPYMPSVKNLQGILDKMQSAGVPEAFGYDFLRDLGFTSSNDRAVVKVLKYIGLLDSAGRPQSAYREFVDQTKSQVVMASRLRTAFDDLYLSDKNAHDQSVDQLKGWFKTKTGASDSVAQKIASTFKALASYGDFKGVMPTVAPESPASEEEEKTEKIGSKKERQKGIGVEGHGLGLVYRFEIHLPDTQNVETHRAIFRALREELM